MAEHGVCTDGIPGILQESGPETRGFHAFPGPSEYIDIRIGRMDEGTEGSATLLEV